MTALRIINAALWLSLFAYMIPGAWAASFGKGVRRGDPMRLGVMAVSFVFAAGYLRWLLVPNSDDLWMALHVLSAACAVYIGFLARAYGRGDEL